MCPKLPPIRPLCVQQCHAATMHGPTPHHHKGADSAVHPQKTNSALRARVLFSRAYFRVGLLVFTWWHSPDAQRFGRCTTFYLKETVVVEQENKERVAGFSFLFLWKNSSRFVSRFLFNIRFNKLLSLFVYSSNEQLVIIQ